MTCLFVGFVCPLNYNYNSDRTGCIPSDKACTDQGYVLNSDGTACVPKTGLIVPFPFIIAALFFFFLVMASWLKDRRRSLFFANYLALLGLIEPLLIITLIISCIVIESYAAMALFILAFLTLVIYNITQFTLFMVRTRKDPDFKLWSS